MALGRSAAAVRRRHLADELGRNLFVLPALFVVVAAVLAEVLAEVDDQLDAGSLPGFLEAPDGSARAILAAIAGGTITTAAVVLSFTLVAVQLASTQYSPRTLGRFLGDRFQQVVMGVVFGTFTYSIVVLREIEGGSEQAGPQLATTGAVVLGIAALLAVLASIDHTARSLQVESIAERVSEAAIAIAREQHPLLDGPAPPPPEPPEPPPDALELRAPRTGWVQQLPPVAVAAALPPGSTARLEAAVGDHVVAGQVLARVWPHPAPASIQEEFEAVLDIGPTRTMQDDVAFGEVQLVDIASRALSTAVNDPYTAQEVILRLTPLLAELVTRDLRSLPVEHDGRWVHPAPAWTVDDHLDLAVGNLRWHARHEPRVLMSLLIQLGQLRDVAADPGPVVHQARVLLDELDRLAPADVARIHQCAREAGWEVPPS